MIDHFFEKACTKERLLDGSVMYSGDPDKDSFTCICRAYVILADREEFLRYCTDWIWYESVNDGSTRFSMEDLIARHAIAS